ncbi:MAG: ABC transporter permease [Chloroflexi bacterium]|nr:ABC transporter permease [Chloroflexota bacterium]
MAYEAANGTLQAEDITPQRSFRVLRRLARKRLALVGLVVIVTIYLAGILAPLIAPYGFADTDFGNTFASPSLEHPLGTDRLGRDMLARVMWASQTTVIISAAVILTGGLAMGVTLGLIAGYAGGRIDNLIMRVADTFFGLPDILLLLLITATVRPRVEDFFDKFDGWPILGGLNEAGLPDYFLIFGALSLFGWVGMARIVRSQVLSLRETDYVMAARAAGARTPRLLFHHLLPNVSNIVIVAVTFSLGAVAGTEIALTWLGIGIQPPHPSFGVMIFDGSGLTNLRAHPNLMLVPAVVVAALLFSFNLLGDALNDVLNPHRR